MKYHPVNRNLTLYYGEQYLGMPIQFTKGPFVAEYLQRLHQTLLSALDEYREVFAFRFDLRMPKGSLPTVRYENQLIDRFIESFKAKIKHNREMARRVNKNSHDTKVHYVWTREVGSRGRPHYHLAILLNHDAYCAIGHYSLGRENIFNRLNEAWASALGVAISDIVGLVEIPRDPSYRIGRHDKDCISDFFFRTSYLCKSATKSFGNGGHGFGTSRAPAVN